MGLRELKALELAARSRITFAGSFRHVPSQSGGGTYRVTSGDPVSCPCEDFSLRGGRPCKHVIAARLVCGRGHGGKPPVTAADEVPKEQTYKQNWRAYNLAQPAEKHRVRVLLADLCRGTPEPAAPWAGRRVSMPDRLFSIAFKAYRGLSTRRYNCDLQDAHGRGHLSRPLHHSKVNAFITEGELTAPPRELVAQSALPLRAAETNFAVGSAGFSTAKFVKWHDEKYGVGRSGHDWVKVHVCTGVKTGVVTAVEIRDRDANDSPLLPPLVRATAADSRIEEVSADKGYLSAENAEVIASVGGTPFIAPKVNTTGAAGGLFEKMFHYYQFRREDFLKHYHRRSNVGSTFSAIKRKMGDSVRARNPVGMVNEVLCKTVCYNLCCVILSQIELGIEATFWQDEPADGPRDIPPIRRQS